MTKSLDYVTIKLLWTYFSNNTLPTRNKTKQYQDYMGFRSVFIVSSNSVLFRSNV